MSGSSVQILAQAHAYIEAGNLEDAENLIRSLLEQDPDNTDAWWLLAHSVRDDRSAREALGQVLRLDPQRSAGTFVAGRPGRAIPFRRASRQATSTVLAATAPATAEAAFHFLSG